MKKDFSSIFNNILEKINEKNPYIFLNKIWGEIIGKFSSKTKIKNLNEGILYVFVSDSRILHELSLLSPIIVDTINKKIKEEEDKNISKKEFLKINSIKYIFNSNPNKDLYRKK